MTRPLALAPRGRGVWDRLGAGVSASVAVWWLACLWLLAATGTVMAQGVLPVPPLSGRVIDQTTTLSAPQRTALENKLAALEAETGSQVVVLIVASTAPEDIAAYAQRVADQWKIGRAAEGDGLLIVSSQSDRRLRIEVAKALEGAIPDLAARRLIDQQLTPAFRQGDFAGGFNVAVDRIAELIRAEKLPAPMAATGSARGGPQAGDGMDWEALAMFFFVGVPVVGGLLTAVLGRRLGSLLTGGAAAGLGWWLTASLLLAGAAAVVAVVLVGVMGVGASRPGGGRGRRGGGPPVIWTGGGGGWGGGSGSGGGFRSGGGGDFGGGGASGSW